MDGLAQNIRRFRRSLASRVFEIAALAALTSLLVAIATGCGETVVIDEGPKGAGGSACSEAACQEPPSVCYQKGGTCSNGSCAYAYADGAGCDDGDACTSGDSCASGVCHGAPLACDNPPETTCVSATTLRTYAAGGTCAAGACSYPSSDTPCPSGCNGGICLGDPCADVQCNQPPSACYQQAGACSNGSCSYVYADGAGCDDGDACTSGDSCASGACKGVALACVTPPAPTCASAKVLRTYDVAGACAAGACSYAHSDTACVLSCNGGTCGAATKPAISAGAGHSCGVLPFGAVKCWGWNANGQLGNGSTTDSHVPVGVAGLSSGVAAVSTHGNHTCAITSVGAVKCWGSNNVGQLGNNSTADSLVPADVAGLSAVAVTASVYHTCALTSVGAVKCWGWNDSGQLGDGSTIQSLAPVDVTGLVSGAVAVSAGLSHTCALTSAGKVKCWGENDFGQLGNGTKIASSTPVDVTGLPSGAVVAISAGYRHTCALGASGAVTCWGENGNGQLGNNSTIPSSIPVDVTGLSSGIIAVSAGGYSTCAISSVGAVKCWGANFYGDLGNNSKVDSPVPVGVTGLSSGIVGVSAGQRAPSALTAIGLVKCWGWNAYGQLGNNSTTNSLVPVDVVGF